MILDLNSVKLPQILYSFEIVLFRWIMIQPKFWKEWIRYVKMISKSINFQKFHQSFPRITWGYFRPTLAPSPILFVIKSRRDCKISPCLSSYVKIRNILEFCWHQEFRRRKFLTKLALFKPKNFDFEKFSCKSFFLIFEHRTSSSRISSFAASLSAYPGSSLLQI